MTVEVELVYAAAAPAEDLVSLVDPVHSLRALPLDAWAGRDRPEAFVCVFDLDLGDRGVASRLRDTLEKPGFATAARLFIFDRIGRRQVVQSVVLGGADYFDRPLQQGLVRAALAKLVSEGVERRWDKLSSLQSAALKTSLKCIEDCFSATRGGGPVPMESVKETSRLVVDAVAGDGLSIFMDGIKNHHNYTFRHSMFVCGMLVAFGNRLSVGAGDLQKLAVGGMLHDIGKSGVALEVLDKPSKLDESEWAIMRTHPGNAEQILCARDGVDPDVVAMATQHHEKLDGTGYPNGLSGAQVSDLVRMTSIVDVYSSLIEKRAYKPAFSREAALEIMAGMQGHLDLDLVKLFRRLVLDHD